MACTHRDACPLFPFLNSSLAGWRNYYCDSADGWRTCARYQQALRGQHVPLSLLPNGRDAFHLQHVGADGSADGGADGGRGADGPDRQQVARTSGGSTLVDLLFEHAPAAAPAPPVDEPPERPATLPHPPSRDAGRSPRAARPVMRVRRPAPSWWKRLTEWMRTPA